MERYRSILVGVDFTPCSAAALRQAMRLAAASNADLRVVHVVDTQIALEMEGALTQMQSGIRDGLIADARRAWREFALQVPEASNLTIEVSVEHRVFGLIRRAYEAAADLLVIGAFGNRRPDVGVGTVATACVRHASCDVLLVRDTHQGGYSTIVAPVDFSETSRRALERAAQIAQQDHAKLHVVHVFGPPWDRYHYRAPTPHADPQFMERCKRLLSQRVCEFVKPIQDASPNLSVTCELSHAGRHRSGIVEYADRVRADLICLGTRGQSNIRDILLGSTAEKALLHSQCSILAVRPDANVSALPAG